MTTLRTIRANCPTDGDVKITSLEIVVFTNPDPLANHEYRFMCPACGSYIWKDCSNRIRNLLVDAGVREIFRTRPDPNIEQKPPGPLLTFDDEIDFWKLLETDDWFEKLLAITDLKKQ